MVEILLKIPQSLVFTPIFPRIVDFFVKRKIVQEKIIHFLEKNLKEWYFSKEEKEKFPIGVCEDKYYLLKALLSTLLKRTKENLLSPYFERTLIFSLLRNIFWKKEGEIKIKIFEKKYGFRPVGFLTISPGKACNLFCQDCYAASQKNCLEKLSFEILERIIKEKTDLFGSYFTVISGGEPFLYQDRGKTILSLAKKFQDNFFLVYTNGILIREEIAKKLSKLGNITPAISLEGLEKETDQRRGEGIFKKILETFKLLRDYKIVFGISITATRENIDCLLKDTFWDFYFEKEKIFYAWIFQYMPIGRGKTDFSLLLIPEERKKLWQKTRNLVREKKYFIVDFWNSGSVSDGCISAGRPGGYFYINWNGDVCPCVFIPYSPVNIVEIYKKGKTLEEIVNHPFFREIRSWQKNYGFKTEKKNIKNWLLPCPIRDHYSEIRKIIDKYQPEPVDEYAKEVLEDQTYKEKMIDYEKKLKQVFDPLWKKYYLKEE